jgi:hypothetical protein
MEELLKIAKENYPVGTVFRSAYSGKEKTVENSYVSESEGNLFVNDDSSCIYYRGIWATIISKPEVNKKQVIEKAEERNEICTKKDNINPSHYAGKIECIDAIESALSPEEFKGFLRGNVLKYNWRCMQKNGVEDLKKAQWYEDRLIKTLENATTGSN